MSFKINYKGTNCRGTLFEYVCDCGESKEVTHPAAENPCVHCDECNLLMNKKPTVPALDADHHDSMRSHNIGWDTE